MVHFIANQCWVGKGQPFPYLVRHWTDINFKSHIYLRLQACVNLQGCSSGFSIEIYTVVEPEKNFFWGPFLTHERHFPKKHRPSWCREGRLHSGRNSILAVCGFLEQKIPCCMLVCSHTPWYVVSLPLGAGKLLSSLSYEPLSTPPSLVCLTPRRDYHPLAVTDIA